MNADIVHVFLKSSRFLSLDLQDRMSTIESHFQEKLHEL